MAADAPMSPLATIQDLLQWSTINLKSKQNLLDSSNSSNNSSSNSYSNRNSNSPCYFVLESLGVPDPEDPENGKAQHSFGPGDGRWTKDFFKSSKPVGPLPAWSIGKQASHMQASHKQCTVPTIDAYIVLYISYFNIHPCLIIKSLSLFSLSSYIYFTRF